MFLPWQCLLQLGGTKVFFSSFALVLPFFVEKRVNTLVQPRTRTRPPFCRWLCILRMTKNTPFCAFVMLSDQSVAISIGYAIFKRPIINIMLTKRQIWAKSSAKTPPALGLHGVCLCSNPTHILHLFCPPTPLSYNLTITRRKNHAWET